MGGCRKAAIAAIETSTIMRTDAVDCCRENAKSSLQTSVDVWPLLCTHACCLCLRRPRRTTQGGEMVSLPAAPVVALSPTGKPGSSRTRGPPRWARSCADIETVIVDGLSFRCSASAAAAASGDDRSNAASGGGDGCGSLVAALRQAERAVDEAHAEVDRALDAACKPLTDVPNLHTPRACILRSLLSGLSTRDEIVSRAASLPPKWSGTVIESFLHRESERSTAYWAAVGRETFVLTATGGALRRSLEPLVRADAHCHWLYVTLTKMAPCPATTPPAMRAGGQRAGFVGRQLTTTGCGEQLGKRKAVDSCDAVERESNARRFWMDASDEGLEQATLPTRTEQDWWAAENEVRHSRTVASAGSMR